MTLKAAMAVSGLLLLFFLVAHAWGNLKMFAGPAAFDDYGAWLRGLGAPALPRSGFLWAQRVALSTAVLVHVGAATVLARRARTARPVRYAHRPRARTGYAARTMRWGGVIILLFVVFHVLDLTTGHLNPVGDPDRPYANVLASFAPRRWYVTAAYTLAVLAVAAHVWHGAFSALRTLGQHTRRGERRVRAAAAALAVGLAAAFLAVPLAVTAGLVH